MSGSPAPTGSRRDLEQVSTALSGWLVHHWPQRSGITGHGLARASAGRANETVFLTVTWDGGANEQELVLRLPPLVASFPDRDPLAEGRLLTRLAAAGLPVPAPVAMEEDPSWFGAPFLVLPRLGGRAPGEVPALDEWLVVGGEARQDALHRGFVEALAAIHRLEPLDLGAAGDTGSPLSAEVERWTRYLPWAADGDPDPGLVDAMAWVAGHQPRTEPAPSLTWGDARLGNLLVDEGTAAVVAILDWELAAAGPAELDLGWYLALDELQARFVGSVLPGFPDRHGTLAAWEAAAGRAAVDVGWHEIFALVRSTAVHDRHARIAAAAGEGPAYPTSEANPLVRWVTRKIERFA